MLFVDAKGTRQPEDIPVIMDERVCSDTIFRVIRLGPAEFVVCDIWVLSGRNIHERLPYEKRSQIIADILEEFHSPDLASLVHINDLPKGTLIRGIEYYDEQPGSIGVFIPAVE